MSLLGNTAELAILLKLKDEFSGPLKNADHQLQGLHSRVGQIGSGVATMGKGLAVAAERIAAIGIAGGVAVAGLAVSATKAAASFQAAMELVHTQAGASQQEVDNLSKSVLALAPQVGTGPEQLAAGLYHIESAGLRGAKALEILTVAAKGAKVGNADLESVTNALIASVNSGIKGTTDMTQAMGVLNAIVGSGNMRMQDLTEAFSTGILSSAKTFGVSIQSVGAALADMTNQGVPAADAATRLRMTLSLLAAPTNKAATELLRVGLKSDELAKAMRGPDGILGAVALLKEHLDKSGLSATEQAQLLSQAFGGGRSSSAIMTLLGSVKQLGVIQDQVNKGTGKFGEAWAATQKDVDQKVANVRASLDTLKITLGEKLLPVAGTILDEATKLLSSPAVTTGIDQFGQAIAGLFTADNISKAETFFGQVADFAHNILPPLVSGLKIAGDVVSTAVGAFMSLPQPLQAAIIGGLAVNKLSGGLIGSGLKQVAQGLLGGAGGGGAGVVGGMLGVQKVFVVNMGAGMGGGLGGGATAAEGWLSKGLKIAGAVTIAAGSIALLAETFKGFMDGVAQNQADLQTKVNQTAQQSPADAAANLAATVASLQKMPIWDRAIANTFSGGQITQDFITAAQKLGSSGLTGGQATTAAQSVQAALDYAKYEGFTSAIGPLTDALKTLTAAANGAAGSTILSGGNIGAGSDWTHGHGKGNVLANLQATPNEGILERAVAHGLHPDLHDIASTAARNAAVAAGKLDLIRLGVADTARAVRAVQFKVYAEFKQNILNNPDLNGPKPTGSDIGAGSDWKHGATGLLGQVSQATRMIVGEAGNETVAILRNPRPSSGGGGEQINVNASVSVRDTATSTVRRGRIGPTPAHQGAI